MLQSIEGMGAVSVEKWTWNQNNAYDKFNAGKRKKA
jgi:hypothetical protein